ncbi:Inositol-1-monophosphatase [Vibrio aerogenes CECT 7868]|uniref:Inositol-1-monophosphatase n=1 Tax=Vibrio aerogenes CECT 7868 TaxID=1216006 RepID=A0A1M6A8E8_9VIBR|nr:inositol monophosphatase family protein [Vibrio aerogenes]SHI32814.1 Inositol-1-monophosphatase [Vibrio aerogenes CECT 7868]
MNNTELSAREQYLYELVYSAGQLALTHFRQRTPGSYTLKGHQDFLTEADNLVEQHIRRGIAHHFPGDNILGEESGGDMQQAPLWVIDPIDGTANFARGIEHFCISIAFYANEQVELGAIYNPATEECYLTRRNGYAVKIDGSGSKRPLTVSQTPDITQATIELGWSTRIPQSQYLRSVEQLLTSGANVKRCGSGALALAWVAEGRTDGYAEQHMNAWDCLAGLLLVREAGGITGQFPANMQDIFSGGPIIATTPQIAGEFSQSVAIPLTQTTESEFIL